MRKSENRDSVQDSSIGKAISVLKSPIKLLRYFRKKILIEPRMRKSQERFLKEMLSGNIDDFTQITDEIMNDSVFHRDIKCQFDSVNLPYSATQRYDWSISNYYLIRKLKPKIVVETGVWHGLSTCYILQALRKNNSGSLISMDLPAYSEEGGYKDLNPFDNKDVISLPKGKNPGWIIPQYLQERWKLILGKTEDTLPPLLDELKVIDFFLHDSEHSYSNMIFEFDLAYSHLSESGVLVADNIHWNQSFYDFCESQNLNSCTYLAYIEGSKREHPFGGTRKLSLDRK